MYNTLALLLPPFVGDMLACPLRLVRVSACVPRRSGVVLSMRACARAAARACVGAWLRVVLFSCARVRMRACVRARTANTCVRPQAHARACVCARCVYGLTRMHTHTFGAALGGVEVYRDIRRRSACDRDGDRACIRYRETPTRVERTLRLP